MFLIGNDMFLFGNNTFLFGNDMFLFGNDMFLLVACFLHATDEDFTNDRTGLV